jgi:hypothetical protein
VVANAHLSTEQLNALANPDQTMAAGFSLTPHTVIANFQRHVTDLIAEAEPNVLGV